MMLPAQELKPFLTLLNQIYLIERRLEKSSGEPGLTRSIMKMKDALGEMGFFYEDPLGQDYKETRTDIEATIAGPGTEKLIVVEVHKPVIRAGKSEFSRVVQKGVVVVQSKEEDPEKNAND
jgi:hypothetical protein